MNKAYLQSSGIKVSNFMLSSIAGLFGGILVTTDGTNDVTVEGFDNAIGDGSGSVIFPPFKVIGTDNYGGFFPPVPISFFNGCDIHVAGTGANVVAYEWQRS